MLPEATRGRERDPGRCCCGLPLISKSSRHFPKQHNARGTIGFLAFAGFGVPVWVLETCPGENFFVGVSGVCELGVDIVGDAGMVVDDPSGSGVSSLVPWLVVTALPVWPR